MTVEMKIVGLFKKEQPLQEGQAQIIEPP